MTETNPTRGERNMLKSIQAWVSRNKWIAIVVVVLLVVLLGWLVWLAAKQNAVVRRQTNNPVTEQYANQLPELKQAVNKNGNDPEARKNYAVALYATGDAKAAEEQYLKAVELNNKDAVAYNNLGNMQRELKKYDDAIGSYKKSIELNPKSLNPYVNLANIQLYMKKQPNDAVATYQQGLRELPGNEQLQSLLASAYESTGDKANAKKTYEAMLAADKDSAVAKAGLERVK